MFDFSDLTSHPLMSACRPGAFYAVLGALSLTAGLLLFKRPRERLRPNPQHLPYPPGPTPRPIVGNMFDLARENEVEHYGAMARQYGELVFFTVLGRNILFVNSFQAASDLFEKRSGNYSDRVHSTMLHELMGWDWTIGHMPYGERWKVHRRMFHRQFQQSVAPVHWQTQRKEAHALLRRLLQSPEDLFEHLRHNAASVIMNVTYGVTIESKGDRFVTIAEKALGGMAEAANPGAFLVDLLPILKYVPEWVPGASFKRKAREWKDAVYEMRDAPFETAWQSWKQGKARSCFVSNLATEIEPQCQTKEEFAKQMEVVKGAAGMSYAAGTESTMSALASFVLAMILHPEVQTKAQAELENVVGQGRLPEFSDRKLLPYVSAIVKEVLRWAPIAPLGLPHKVTRDDEYKGYFIPAGTTIIGNTWEILHDPVAFPNPNVFNPDRFMNRSTKHNDPFPTSDPLSTAFGYGRRMCPGRYMADAQIWISIACILAVFEIGCGEVDEKGRGVKPEAKFTSGFIRNPLPYMFAIKPRGEYAKCLIEQTAEADVEI